MTDWVPTVIAVVALVVAVTAYVGERRSSDFELARQLHLDLTTGDVAKARERLAALRDLGSHAVDINSTEALASYFTLLWAFERVLYGRQSLLRRRTYAHRRLLPAPEAVQYLDNAIRWHVTEWSLALPEARKLVSELINRDIDDKDSIKSLENLGRTLRV